MSRAAACRGTPTGAGGRSVGAAPASDGGSLPGSAAVAVAFVDDAAVE